ncbi:zinc finger, C3HC4 type [Ancylostoma caninum]|uniref:Zinc finger, C3HC4 type n=1 Tax=Ancylostoma caninum TaxID=29170 RepID=A0A368G5D4_ANCCA|nr:zinc finger, C3HC4 type [Ancylostoma caninum]RCN40372.1 zinc finger, C3HC4 type [Ancylostoma caninum]
MLRSPIATSPKQLPKDADTPTSVFATPTATSARILPTRGTSKVSTTSTDEKALCRICLDGSQEHSKLICPCNCKGTVARTHSACLEKWVEVTHNTNCQICGTDYELESYGWKKFTDWSYPRPLSNEWEDVLDFRCCIAWIIYFSRYIYMNAAYGTQETNRQIAEAIGDGVFAKCWWFAFWMNMVYYGSITVLLADQWITENRVYRFRDRRQKK